MVRSIKVKYEDYYVIRGIKEDKNGFKHVIVEKYFDQEPSEEEIVRFLMDYKKVEFATVEHLYKIIRDRDIEFFA